MFGIARSSWLAGLALAVAVTPALAAVPTDPAKRAEIIGKPAALVVQPENLTLTGPRGYQQIVVSGKYADGSVRDLTALCDVVCESDLATVEEGGFLMPKKNGTA